jgi:hypothetical protein
VAFVEPNAVQIRITLAEIEPEIWRRVVVPRTFHLGDLHHVIQAAFGWWDYHLHQFMIGGLRYGDVDQIGAPEFEAEPRGFDESEVRLLDFGYSDRVAFIYEYDFGDGWEHIVEFEEKLTLEPAPRVPLDAPVERAPGPQKTWAASADMPGSWRSWPIVAIPNTPTRAAGLAVTSIRSGSI